MIQIAPSMLSADFLHLAEDVEMVNRHADIFHLDIMDGIQVPNLSYGFPVVEAIASIASRRASDDCASGEIRGEVCGCRCIDD